MAVTSIHLRKLLMLFQAPQNLRVSKLREDIRNDISRASSEQGGSGGDFYVPFWSDAKRHAIGTEDLTEATRIRIASNSGRQNLYPRLTEGFLTWWNERRRWTNAPFQPVRSPHARYRFPRLNAVVKVDNILAVRDANNVEHFVYPYFSPTPLLSENAARHGLWLLTQALPQLPTSEVAILDLIRGQAFSVGRPELRGSEEAEFLELYARLISEQQTLRRDYN